MFKKAMEELDALSKSENPEDELEALAKALQAELGEGVEVVLKKAVEKTQAELDAEADTLRKAQEAEEAETLRKAKEVEEAEAERLRKSQQTQMTEEELLVEASELYRDLTKAVVEGHESTLGELDVLKKSVGALLNLNIKLAGVVGELVKSQRADMEEMKKSLGSMGAGAVVPNAARIGTGAAEHEEGELKKSRPEIQEALQKAVQEGTVAAYWLSNFGTHKNVELLPQEVRDIIEV